MTRAAVCREYGPPETIRIEEVPAGPLTPGTVRVRVAAAAVNFPDVLLMANKYQVTAPLPFVPGSEFAGTVAECGDGVAGVGDGVAGVGGGVAGVGGGVAGVGGGDRVMGTSLTGAFAEEVVVPAGSLTLVPDGVTDAHAACFGVAHRTAYHVLRSVACVQPGERLVVLGAGGGVGLAAVQLGAVLGASVTAVASSEAKLSAAAAHGAVRVINHRSAPGGLRQALREAFPDGVDVVLDPVGGDLAEPALRSLRWGGRFVTVGYASGTVPRIPLNLVLLKGCRILGFQFRDFAAHAPDELRLNEAALLELLAAGRALPHIGATFKLAEAAAALRYVADGNAIGKVVLDVAGWLWTLLGGHNHPASSVWGHGVRVSSPLAPSRCSPGPLARRSWPRRPSRSRSPARRCPSGPPASGCR
jgi:NADPH:quinone reductase